MNFISKRMESRGQGGFTLIELLVVIAVLAILGGVAVFAVGNLTGESKTAACQAEYDSVRTAILAANAKGVTTATSFLDGTPKYWGANLTSTGSPSSTIAGLTNRAACSTATLP